MWLYSTGNNRGRKYIDENPESILQIAPITKFFVLGMFSIHNSPTGKKHINKRRHVDTFSVIFLNINKSNE
jgi:hypothetical protein